MGTHNVVFVATENDSVYAFDADASGPALWHTSFINPQANPPITAVPSTDIGCGDLVPIIGITATPVIDSTSGTMYVVSKEKFGPGNYRQRLHALDITTGLERSKSPVTITATSPGTATDGNGTTVPFNPLTQLGRPALTLSNGIVYLAFASHCDIDPFHGWVLGYDETKLTQEVVFNSTPNGTNGGIWQSGCGLGVDTNGDLIAMTGDGDFDTGASPQDFGDSFLRLTPNPGATVSMTVASYFTPLNELMLEDQDLDMGSGGNLLLPDQPGPQSSSDDWRGQVGLNLPGQPRQHGRVQRQPGPDGAGDTALHRRHLQHSCVLAGKRAGRRLAEYGLHDSRRRVSGHLRALQRDDPDAASGDRLKLQIRFPRCLADDLRQRHHRRGTLGNRRLGV